MEIIPISLYLHDNFDSCIITGKQFYKRSLKRFVYKHTYGIDSMFVFYMLCIAQSNSAAGIIATLATSTILYKMI